MGAFQGTWKDLGNLIINIEQSSTALTVQYANGRGPFKGKAIRIGNNEVAEVDFSDGGNPDAGLQIGVLNFKEDKIYWGNDTQWTKV